MTTVIAGVKQPHEARYLNGRPINWKKPPPANKIVAWSKRDSRGRAIRGSFRTICHMNRLNNLSIKRFGKQIVVIQPDWNTTVKASKGTHDFDATWDVHIPGVPWRTQERFFRANGFACWLRYPPAFGYHIHGFTLPPHSGKTFSDDFKQGGFKVGIYVDGGYSLYGKLVTSSQIADYYNEAFGLSGKHRAGSDNSWFPPNKQATIFNLNAYVSTRAKRAA